MTEKKSEAELKKEEYDDKDTEVNISFEDPSDSSKEFTRHDIKSDPILLTRYFIILHNEWKRIFGEEKEQDLFRELYNLWTRFNSSVSVSYKSFYKEKIYEEVSEKYPDISQFIDLCWEVFEIE